MLPSFRFDCVLRFSSMRSLRLIRFEPHHIRDYSNDGVFVILKWKITRERLIKQKTHARESLKMFGSVNQ